MTCCWEECQTSRGQVNLQHDMAALLHAAELYTCMGGWRACLLTGSSCPQIAPC